VTNEGHLTKRKLLYASAPEERKGIMPQLLDRLRLILDHSHNAYTFRYRCRGLHIIIEKQADGQIMAYYDDDRDGRVTIDTSNPPFDKILRYSP
jgi:hypothetical protein